MSLSEASEISDRSDADVLGVDEAVSRLAAWGAQQARIVELRFFGGLSVPETAEALCVSVATVKRDWTIARAWLRPEIRRA